MNDDDDGELRNPFPSPPSHYTNYTTHNLNLLRLLKERSSQPELSSAQQHDILHDQSDVPDWPLTQLEKPRVDWILDDPEGCYDVFGDRWFIKEPIPSLADMGGNQLYPIDPSVDRRPALLSILRTLVVSYSTLTKSLLAPPPPTNVPPEWQQHVEWITVMAQNIMAAANDLRPVQARCNLELMMKRQLDLRKEETRILHEKCDNMEAKLAALRQATAAKVQGMQTTAMILDPPNDGLNDEDVFAWADSV